MKKLRWIKTDQFYIMGNAYQDSVIANDSAIQHWELGLHLTQKNLDGTSCNSQFKRFFFNKLILMGGTVNGGDISYGRKNKIPEVPIKIQLNRFHLSCTS